MEYEFLSLNIILSKNNRKKQKIIINLQKQMLRYSVSDDIF